MPHRAQGRDVVTGARLLRQSPDAAHHRRHQIEPGRLVARHGGQGRLGVEPRGQHQVAAGQHGGDRRAERAVVIERSRHQRHGVGVQPPQTAGRGGHHAGRARQDQLGLAGRSARGRGLPGRRDGVGQVRLVVAEGQQAVDVDPGPVDDDVGAGDHHRRGGQFDHLAQFGRRQPPGDGLRRRPQLPAGEGRLDEPDAVGQADGDEVAVPDAQLGQGAGDAVGAPVQRAPGQAVVLAAHRRRVGLFGGQLLDAGGEGLRDGGLVGHAAGFLGHGVAVLRGVEIDV